MTPWEIISNIRVCSYCKQMYICGDKKRTCVTMAMYDIAKDMIIRGLY